jgi:hypothetical protein
VTARALLFTLLSVGLATADEPLAKIAVDFDRPAVDAWLADALGAMLERELDRFHQVALTPRLEGRCPDRAAACLVDAYRQAGADLLIHGALRGNTLHYAVYETWTGAQKSAGGLQVDGLTTATLERHLGDILRPILGRGGLLAQRPLAETSQKLVLPAFPLYWFLAMLGFIVGPALLVSLRRRALPGSWRWSLLLLLTVTAIYFLARARESFPERSLGVLAGMLWGSFALTNARWIFSPIPGLGRTRHDSIRPLLASWLAVALWRGSILLVYLPVLLLRRVAGFSPGATWAWALPLLGLLAQIWLFAFLDQLAQLLDDRLVVGVASPRNPWHGTIKRYFMTYLRRNGAAVDAGLLDRTLFLPSRLPYVTSYGGGFAHPRMLVGEETIRLALGELPDEDENDRDNNPEQLYAGVLVPRIDARHPPTSADALRRKLTATPLLPRGHAPKFLGEKVSLLGWVAPQSADELSPVIASGSENSATVRLSLAAHFAPFKEDPLEEDAPDPGNPEWRDFLFGGLLREMAALSRGDGALATLRHMLAAAARRVPLVARVTNLQLVGPGATLADASVALNGGLHHLIQYLYLRRGEGELLTQHADAPLLQSTSKEILHRLAQNSSAEANAMGRNAHRRLRTLAPFLQGETPRPLLGRLGWALVALSLAVGLGGIARKAILYHPIYMERLRAQTQGASK